MAQILPPELWLEVFEWATHNPLLNVSLSHSPFQPAPFREKIQQVDNLDVRLTISLVCRQWRLWVARSLFSDINIKDRSSASGLRKALEKPTIADGYYSHHGEMVRRVVLQYHSTVPGAFSKQMQSLEILKLCPYIHTLLRPRFSLLEGLRFDYEADGVSLPTLQRLEWWHHNEAERSGGINSLSAVLHGAPNISYLFVGGIRSFNHLWLQKETLPHLQTLRLNTISGLFLHQIISHWSLPSLTYIVLDSPPPDDSGWESIWNAFGSQLKTIEFGKSLGFFVDDQISSCLKGCPGLQELNFYLRFTLPAAYMQPHTSLTTVRLHAAISHLLPNDAAVWDIIDRHFKVLCGTDLPALRRIILYGDWKSILHDPRFASIRETLQNIEVLEISS